ncbi:MAG: hypothetical protein GXY67_13160 [Clostridiales bacterium]|nr:hypothetical protein [Clostridiales bacterium]
MLKWNKLQTEEIFHKLVYEPHEAQEVLADLEYESVTPLHLFLLEHLARHECTIPEIITKSQLSKPYVYQVFEGRKLPGRDALLRIAFAMNFSVMLTQKALSLAQKPILYPRVHRDAALIYCLGKGMTLYEVSEFLSAIQERALL